MKKRACPSESFAERFAEMLGIYHYENIRRFKKNGVWYVSYDEDSGKDLTASEENGKTANN